MRRILMTSGTAATAIVDRTQGQDLDRPSQTADLVRVYLNEIGKRPLLTAAEEVAVSYTHLTLPTILLV